MNIKNDKEQEETEDEKNGNGYTVKQKIDLLHTELKQEIHALRQSVSFLQKMVLVIIPAICTLVVSTGVYVAKTGNSTGAQSAAAQQTVNTKISSVSYDNCLAEASSRHQTNEGFIVSSERETLLADLQSSTKAVRVIHLANAKAITGLILPEIQCVQP